MEGTAGAGLPALALLCRWAGLPLGWSAAGLALALSFAGAALPLPLPLLCRCYRRWSAAGLVCPRCRWAGLPITLLCPRCRCSARAAAVLPALALLCRCR